MVFGLSIGGKKDKSKFNETFDETEDYDRTGVNMPIVPEAWQGNYDALYGDISGGRVANRGLGPGSTTDMMYRGPGAGAFSTLSPSGGPPITGPGVQREGTGRLLGLGGDTGLDLGGAQDDLRRTREDYTRAYMDRGSNTLGAFFGNAPKLGAHTIDPAQVAATQYARTAYGPASHCSRRGRW